jgi:hypothetical protein
MEIRLLRLEGANSAEIFVNLEPMFLSPEELKQVANLVQLVAYLAPQSSEKSCHPLVLTILESTLEPECLSHLVPVSYQQQGML